MIINHVYQSEACELINSGIHIISTLIRFYTFYAVIIIWLVVFFFFQAEDGIRDVERSRGLGDVYKRQDYRGI